jgi:lipopolysaccharide/colanic/teichoic acid biosynthesis glycosyltransferase
MSSFQDELVPKPAMTRVVKYAADRLLGALLLLLLAPLLLGIVVWILLGSGRPALIRQLRAGKDGKPFGMFKFRTMVQNAVELGRELQLTDDPFGVVKDDPRITEAGRFLRRTGLDELPQLLNVVRGEMSLVGPRPDLVEQAALYTDDDRRRLTVRPGITGWAQVRGREEISWPERIALDIWYLEHWSLGLDVKILFMTVSQFGRDEPEPIEDTMNIERAREAAKR